jgi:AhpD family alkylhydroperoxidase
MTGDVMLQALRIRDFRLLWAGDLISSIGSWLLAIAIPAHVLQVTGSLRDTGLTLAAEYLPPLVLGPAAGVVTDRWDKRRLMIGTGLFRAGAVAVMLAGIAPGRYWILYAALVAESSGGVLYSPAEQARTPAIVGTGLVLSSANSLNAFADGAVRLIGGPLGGILLAFCGVRWLIFADALSYLVGAAANFMTSRTDGGSARRHRVISDLTRDLLDGVRILRDQPVTRALFPVTVIFLAANASLGAVFIPFGIQKLGGSEHTGLLLACLGVGFLLGAPVLRALLDRLQPRILLTASLTATGVLYYLLFSSSSLATALPAAAAIGMFGSMSQVIALTAMQRVTPGAALGRVSAAFLTGEAAATLVGAVTGPFLAQTVHLDGAAIASAVATLGAAALACLTVPRLSHPAGRSRQSDVTLNDGMGEIIMDARLDFNSNQILQKFVKNLNSAATAIPTSILPPGTANLMLIRASQINGCSVCTDMHTKDAEHAGETSVRLNLVAAWRDAKVFTDAERAALELTEQGTRIADAAGGVGDEAWANAAKHYDTDQLAALVCIISFINTYNRLNVISQNQGGGYQPGQWG